MKVSRVGTDLPPCFYLLFSPWFPFPSLLLFLLFLLCFVVVFSVFCLLGVFPGLAAELGNLSLSSALFLSLSPSPFSLPPPFFFSSSISSFLPPSTSPPSLGVCFQSRRPGIRLLRESRRLSGEVAVVEVEEGWREEVGKEIGFHISSALLCLPRLPPPPLPPAAWRQSG